MLVFILLFSLAIIFLIKLFFIKKGQQLFSFIISVSSSIKQAVANNKDVKNLVKKYPLFFNFIKNRLSKQDFSGLPLTLFILMTIYTLSLLAGITEDVITSDVITVIDTNLSNNIATLRTSRLTIFFFWITLLGKWQVVAVFSLVIATILWLKNKRLHILILAMIMSASEAFTWLGKLFFHRTRPSVAMYLEDSFSFPSGHSTFAVAFCGFLIYILLKNTKQWKAKVDIFFAGLTMILLIGFSRIYLGVHYLSDVWSGYLVGVLWLVIGISILEWKYSRKKQEIFLTDKTTRFLSWFLVAVSVLFYIGFALNYKP